MSIDYPAVLPCLSAKPYSYNQTNTIATTEFQSGRTRHRRRFKDVPVYFQVQGRFSTGELGVFEAWKYYKLSDVTWFDIKLNTGRGIELWTVRFMASDISKKALGLELWELSFVLQARQQRFIDEDDLDGLLSAGSLTFGTDTQEIMELYYTTFGGYPGID